MEPPSESPGRLADMQQKVPCQNPSSECGDVVLGAVAAQAALVAIKRRKCLEANVGIHLLMMSHDANGLVDTFQVFGLGVAPRTFDNTLQPFSDR
jgi:hypothetical protein